MGLLSSKLSSKQIEILRHSSGMKAEELRPLFGSIPLFMYCDRESFQKHNFPNSIAFLLVRGEYIVNSKSTFGGKQTYYI